jgi:hypothetical protein
MEVTAQEIPPLISLLQLADEFLTGILGGITCEFHRGLDVTVELRQDLMVHLQEQEMQRWRKCKLFYNRSKESVGGIFVYGRYLLTTADREQVQVCRIIWDNPVPHTHAPHTPDHTSSVQHPAVQPKGFQNPFNAIGRFVLHNKFRK